MITDFYRKYASSGVTLFVLSIGLSSLTAPSRPAGGDPGGWQTGSRDLQGPLGRPGRPWP
jgi:hypothetical protein